MDDFVIIHEEEYKGFEITGLHPKFDKETIVYGVSHEDAYDMKLLDTLDEAREFIDKLYGGR